MILKCFVPSSTVVNFTVLKQLQNFFHYETNSFLHSLSTCIFSLSIRSPKLLTDQLKIDRVYCTTPLLPLLILVLLLYTSCLSPVDHCKDDDF